MNRTLLLSLLAYGLILLGLATLNGIVLALAIPLLIYLGAGLLFEPREIQLEITRSVNPPRAAPDTSIEVKLVVTNQGTRIDEILVEDLAPPELDLIQGETSLLAALPAGASLELAYTLRSRRGLFEFKGVQVTTGDKLGILRQRKILKTEDQVFAPPIAPRLKRVAIRPRQTQVYSGVVPARQGGPGVEFFGVRSYHPGDPMQRINWKASARFAETLFSNEFEQERAAAVGLILDARQRCDILTPQGTLFEHQVVATAALAQALLSDGNRVGLLVYGGFLDWTYPGYGKIQQERILHALTRARTGESLIFEDLQYLPTRILPVHSQLILISPLLNEDVPILIQLRARGYQVLVVSPDPIAFQSTTNPAQRPYELAERLARLERGLLFNRLRHAGVQVLNWDVGVPFDHAMQLALRRLPTWFHPLRGIL